MSVAYRKTAKTSSFHQPACAHCRNGRCRPAAHLALKAMLRSRLPYTRREARHD